MKSKKTIKDEIELTLKVLQEKIDSMKEKVDKLCETTDCFGTVKKNNPQDKDSSP
jgi:hypothetical protein